MFCKQNSQKKILKLLRDLPMQDGGEYGQKNCEELSTELGLDIKDVIAECHKLSVKDMIGMTGRQGEDGKTLHEKTRYMILPSGVKSLEKNWNQRILNIIFGASAIITIIVAVHQIYPLW